MNIVQREEFLPLTPQAQLMLLALCRRPMTGYEVRYWVNKDSHGLIELSRGTVFPALKGFLLMRWVTEELSGRTKSARMYTITHMGKEALMLEVDRQERIGQLARQLVQEIKPTPVAPENINLDNYF